MKKKIISLCLAVVLLFVSCYLVSGFFEEPYRFPTATTVYSEKNNMFFDGHSSFDSQKDVFSEIKKLNLSILDKVSEDFDIHVYGVNETVDTIYKWYDYEYCKNGWIFNQSVHVDHELGVYSAYFYMKGLSGKLLVLGTGDVIHDMLHKQSVIIILEAPLWVFNDYKEMYL